MNDIKIENKLRKADKCCSVDDGFDRNAPSADNNAHDHEMMKYTPVIISAILLFVGLSMEHVFQLPFFTGWVKLLWFTVAYVPVAIPVIRNAFESIMDGEVFTEFFLMSIATLGAFAIGEYSEGVAVMLFYTIGELFQQSAVRRAKTNIQTLLDVRPHVASVLRNEQYIALDPLEVEVGEQIQVKVGEKVPLDGVLLSPNASMNTAALTGESKPGTVLKGEKVLAGAINLNGVVEVEVTKLFNDSSLARILDLVQNASSKKAKTELLIRRLAKIYTPIVAYLAIAIVVIPFFVVSDYVFSDWLYRAMVFLVISCPCALVISIPLGYFGGLGAASRNGILFKGAKYMDSLLGINHLVMDKTGTVTKGVFKIKEIKVHGGLSEQEMMKILVSIESKSSHPIAKAITEYPVSDDLYPIEDVKEVAGKGLIGIHQGKSIYVGNVALLEENGVSVPQEAKDIVDSIVVLGIDDQYAGYVVVADELKPDAEQFLIDLKSKTDISQITMLSGDKDAITRQVARELSISSAKGGLLPEDKLNEVEKLKIDPKTKVAFVGDGINDAPVLAESDVGIAMGGMGSDIAIETADIIIQTDEPSKITTAINISKSTQKVIWQNITLAIGIKVIILIFGAFGMASMWGAVFADVGVALLAILNAVRIQRMTWD